MPIAFLPTTCTNACVFKLVNVNVYKQTAVFVELENMKTQTVQVYYIKLIRKSHIYKLHNMYAV